MAGPLAALRIVDMTSALMGPYATQIMGDLGAEVIKVESGTGDSLRQNGQGRNPGMGPLFLHVNRSKRSIVLDLKHPSGLEAMLALLETADVFVFNMRPVSMKRLGLAYDEVALVNPKIIYCGLRGFGEDGPYAGRPAYDDIIQGASALPSLSARATGEPHYTPLALVDRIAGMTGVYAVLAALYSREKTGEGQELAVPMFERMVEFVLSDHMYGWTFDPPIGGTGYPRHLVPDRRPYKTKDGYICALPYLDKHWQRFFEIAGMPELQQDARFISMGARTQNVRRLYEILAEALLARTTTEWMALFAESDIPAMPLHTPESVMSDPHLTATGFFQMVEHPTEGRIRTMSNPVNWTTTVPEIKRQAPRLGEHSTEILRECGFSEERIAALVAAGVIPASADNNSK